MVNISGNIQPSANNAFYLGGTTSGYRGIRVSDSDGVVWVIYVQTDGDVMAYPA